MASPSGSPILLVMNFPLVDTTLARIPSCRLGGKKLVLGEVVSRQYALVGRGTLVVECYFDDDEGGSSDYDHVAKISWLSAWRKSEVEIVRDIQKLPRASDHISRIICNADVPTIVHPPEFCLKKQDGPWTLRVLVEKKLLHLEKLQSWEELRGVVVDVLHCLKLTSEKGILHRDISIGNVMFRVDEGGKKRGVLRDWDLALVEDHEGHQSRGPDTRRTGTVPFMAIDLLNGADQTHFARHDVESTLWLLVFVTSEYEGGSMKNPFNRWERLTMIDLAESKGYFLHEPHRYTPTRRYGWSEGHVRALINKTASLRKEKLCSLLTHVVYLEILQNPLPP